MLTHRRAKIVAVGTLGAGFRVANVTFRHIVCERTRKCIYVKPAADPFNTGGTTVEAAYENISVVGPTLQFPVMIGPTHQFFNPPCKALWPLPVIGSACSVESNATVNVSILGMRITGENGPPLSRGADFVISARSPALEPNEPSKGNRRIETADPGRQHELGRCEE